tara:strand:+ start:1404 stop:1715 length:312 start_codon:yes stop_codon:yes gene_type:complete
LEKTKTKTDDPKDARERNLQAKEERKIMLSNNINPDPYVAFDALKKIDEIVAEFIRSPEENTIDEKTIEFLKDLRIYCRSIYYIEPEEIDEAKSAIKKENEDA